jgi:hypothetical protein
MPGSECAIRTPNQTSPVEGVQMRMSLITQQLNSIVVALKKLSRVFPLAGLQAEKVEQMRYEVGF